MRETFRIEEGAGRAAGTCALCVVAKAPAAGRVKTRLVPPLTPEEAAALGLCFLRDACANVAGVAADADAAGVAVYTPAEALSFFEEILPRGFYTLPQRGDSLTERLTRATRELFAAGFSSVCLINSDSPTLPPAFIRAAARALARPGDRLVLGPADDGGYYLAGLKRAHPRIFADIEWSTPHVFAQTVEHARSLGLEVETLPRWYDVDDAASLARLARELFAAQDDGATAAEKGDGAPPPRRFDAPHTRDWLEKFLQTERGRATALSALGPTG
ncbi:MAG TPA: TIGR04282 family arsenosugar biosynthesis glycosyltransferase [Pyrinomonadaceae bacterium]|nr:TIGR04282 family arsenosugar biosynthesis glycosyltransferase [Pyrinomonadaceae bacterium]